MTAEVMTVGRILKAAIALLSICGASLSMAADAAVTPVGKTVANFSLPDFHGKMYSLDDYQDKPVVLAFLGTECPLAKLYAPRLRDLAAEFAASGVVFFGIDANLQDSLTEIGAFARTSGITFPMLKDNNNEIADRLGAVRTPEVFLLDRQRVVRYWGRIDDQYGLKTGGGYAKPKLTENNLAVAIHEVLAGRQVSQPVVKADGCFIGRVTKTAPHGDVTYSKQISRIIQNRCLECHRPGEVAPFAMTSYDEVVGWAETIREVVELGRMPPWFADPRFGHFSNDARLSDAEKQQVRAWVENGCPRGDDSDLPPRRDFAEGWTMGEPDQIVYMSDKPHTVPAEGAVGFQRFTVDPGWTTDRWIQATEIRPGNRAVVHHARVDILPENVSDAFPREGIGAYVPGNLPNIWQPGTAVYVPANSKFLFEMHYTSNGSPQDDRSMIGIRFADPKSVKKIVRCTIVNERAIRIPAGDPDYVVKTKVVFSKDIQLLILWPHMHLRGKSFRFDAEYPDGTTEVLLDVPNYDFNWQYRYLLKEPKLMPRGTTMHCTAHYDNSAENLANPDPTRVVTVGNQTWDEMMQGNYYAIDAHRDVACIALVALSMARQQDSAHGSEVTDELKKLFELGVQSTPSAIAAAKAQYQQLKSSHPQDRRIDYAFALALVNQQQYHDAIELLSRYLEADEPDSAAHGVKIWAEASVQDFRAVLHQAGALAEQFPRDAKLPLEEQYRDDARALGVLFAYLERVQPDAVDATRRDQEKRQILARLGRTYAPDFEQGQIAVLNRLREHDARPSTIDAYSTVFSTYLRFPYQQQQQRVLSWFAR